MKKAVIEMDRQGANSFTGREETGGGNRERKS